MIEVSNGFGSVRSSRSHNLRPSGPSLCRALHLYCSGLARISLSVHVFVYF